MVETLGSTYSLISRCPDDALSYIFEYVVEEGSHLIRPILFVNKRFNLLATSNPILWRKISLTFDRDMTECNSLSVAYVNICYERSGNMLLDIFVDCRDIPGEGAFIAQYICNEIGNRSLGEKERQDLITYLLCKGQQGAEQIYVTLPFYKSKEQSMESTIYALFETEHSCNIRFTLPELEHWTLVGPGSRPYIPDIDALQVTAKTTGPKKGTFTAEMDGLTRLFSRFKTTVSLTLEGLNHPESCITRFGEMKADGLLPK
ncbi:hypothetical protein FRC17_005706, partial [Serendipita sp. 399]